MKVCSSCGRSIQDDDGLQLIDGRFFCKSGGCEKRFLDSVADETVVPDILQSGEKVAQFTRPEAPAAPETPAASLQTCELCHRVHSGGHSYRFYYGKDPDTSFLDRLLKLVGIASPPVIAGRESVWICPNCVGLRKWLSYGLLAILLVIFAFLFVDFIGKMSLSPALMPLSPAALGLCFILLPPRGEQETAERLAIGIKKRILRQKGYNVFLTNRQFSKLR